ncbi:hypothetical protein Asp14428_73790 [Actinoplanes sp. NBRC 14428]|nr:hypothetical protein Asp14428_73790 [Actinoplanes sp. NBRC 14428]
MTHYTNVANDNATVHSQIGLVRGDVHFHYQMKGGAPVGPEKFRVGRNYLFGNAPRRAEELIGEAAAYGCASTEVAYYWLLATLSGRSFDHLDQAQLDQLAAAHQMARQFPSDPWSTAVETVYQLISCLAKQERAEGDLDAHEFDQALRRFLALDPVRQSELRRHLDMVLSGGVQDQLEAIGAAAMREQRLAGNRALRVPKFFMPPPAEPRHLLLEAGPDAGSAWVKLVLGGSLLLIGLVVAVPVLIEAGWFATPAVLALIGLGSYLMVQFGVENSWLNERSRREEARFSHRAAVQWYPVEDQQFIADLRNLVDARFRTHLPQGTDESYWMGHTAGVRASLVDELLRQYGWQRGPNAPYDIDWLVNHHARRLATSWLTGTFYGFREQLKVPFLDSLAFTMGVVCWVASILLVFGSSVVAGSFAAFLLVPMLGVGLPLAWSSGRDVLLKRRRQAAAIQDREARYADEWPAFQAWQSYLADTPDDLEMARWLDYDKAYIRVEAMKTFGLTNRDVLSHVILTQVAPLADRARVLFGPPRYSRYDVRLFLLSEGGVREVNTTLDFATGYLSNEHRRSFRYETLSSADVGEVGLQFESGHRHVVPLAEQGAQRQRQLATHKLTFSRALRLTLNNGQQTFLVIENFDLGLIDRMRENLGNLDELARDAAGVSSALRILEAIAAEGSQWIEQERRRRDRRLRAFQKRQQHGQYRGIAHQQQPSIPDDRSAWGRPEIQGPPRQRADRAPGV